MSVKVDNAASFKEMVSLLSEDGFTPEEAEFVADASGLKGDLRNNFIKLGTDPRYLQRGMDGKLHFNSDVQTFLDNDVGSQVRFNKVFLSHFRTFPSDTSNILRSAIKTSNEPPLDKTLLEAGVKIHAGLKNLEVFGFEKGLMTFFPNPNA